MLLILLFNPATVLFKSPILRLKLLNALIGHLLVALARGLNPGLLGCAVGDARGLFVLLELLNFGFKPFVGLPEVNNLLSQSGNFFFFISGLFFEFLAFFFRGNCLFHASFHLLHELCELAVFFIFLAHFLGNIGILGLHLANDDIALLKFLLDDLELLWVGEGILAFDDLFELVTEAGTFIDIHLVLHLELLQLRAPYVTL